ncbi:hypothetical protein JB92DRAFT_3098182 [Gautieria morchelliformis]|nr:hypothetical protein JB92DRAFT_3098182 [Gautieria morchelliformis]
MQKLPTETSDSNLRTTYMVTQAVQYHEIPPPNTLKAQTEATAGHTSEDNQSSRQDHVEEPHSLHEPETPLLGRSTCRATSPSAGASATDLEHKLPGPSKGQAKRKTCVDKEVTQTKEPQGCGKRPRMLSEKAAIAEQTCGPHIIIGISWLWWRQAWYQGVKRLRGWRMGPQGRRSLAGIAHGTSEVPQSDLE